MKFLLVAHTILFLLFNSIVYANNNIVFINMDKVLSTSKPGSFVLRQLEDLNKKNIESFKKKETLLKEQEKNLINQKNILSDVEYNDRINKRKSEINNYNASKKKKILDFNTLRQKNTNKFLTLINEILANYSDENKISIILQKKNLILGKSELDITDKVIIIVNNEIKEFEIK